jgi:hypothetical protein
LIVLKPALVPELGYSVSGIDDKWQFRAKVGFTTLSTRQDTIFNYGVLVSSGATSSYQWCLSDVNV